MLSSLQGQITSLRHKVPAAKCRHPSGALWTINLVTPDLKPICVISVKLPPGFPVRVGPELSLSAPLHHPWIASDQTTITGHPHLAPPWCAEYDVGQLVLDVITQFQKIPPRPATTSNIGGATSTIPHSPPPSPVERPWCPSSFASLNSISVEELEFLKANPAALDQIIWDTKQVKGMLSHLENVVATAIRTAKEAASQQEADKEGYADMKRLAEQMTLERNQSISLHSEISTCCVGRCMEELSAQLAQEADENRKEAEKVRQRLHSHHVDWNEFEREYFEQRRNYHSKKAKQEKINFDMTSKGRRGGQPIRMSL
eukprot:GHVS01010869.1.p1 GENE.GHVS01010869.1~~GHVS01010869.1.p1  ORF type:complete len:315 (+),score=43.14 GHVS01010869.1:65-1009(+)